MDEAPKGWGLGSGLQGALTGEGVDNITGGFNPQPPTIFTLRLFFPL